MNLWDEAHHRSFCIRRKIGSLVRLVLVSEATSSPGKTYTFLPSTVSLTESLERKSSIGSALEGV
jgi:hypothetical protein